MYCENKRNPSAPAVTLGILAGLLLLPMAAPAAPVTLSGTVSYQGTHSGDTLYVAVLDTTGVEDVTVLDIHSYAVGAPPFDQAYSLSFDNAGVASTVFIASILDVGGGGLDVTGDDVFGWYAGAQTPTGIPSSSSASGLDFALPRAEIHGTVTFVAGQTGARIDVSPDALCLTEGFRPRTDLSSPGSYAVVGIYPGTYCVKAEGETDSGTLYECYGDPDCQAPVTVTLGAMEVRTGIDFDFSLVPVETVTWGGIKSRYR